MFFNTQIDWNTLEIVHVLTLRAFAPNNVFDATAETGYLTRVGDNPELAELSKYIFSDDYQFVTNLPSDFKNQMIQIIQMVYRAGIRKTDSRVKSM